MTFELTPDQEARIPEYVERWINKYTEPLNEENTREAVVELYEHFSLKEPTIIYGDSPKHCVELAKRDGKTREEIRDSAYVSTWWGSWAAWYEFADEVCQVEFDKNKFNRFTKFVENIHYSIAFDETIYISQKPEELHYEGDRLHADLKPAIKYKDGFGVYALNGVLVPEEMVMTPADELSMEYYKTISSADIRTEFIAKVGIHRMFEHGKKIDSYEKYLGTYLEENQPLVQSKYELYDFSAVFGGDENAKYLAFNHLTTEARLAECVKGCTTIPQALAYRMDIPEEMLKEVSVVDAV